MTQNNNSPEGLGGSNSSGATMKQNAGTTGSTTSTMGATGSVTTGAVGSQTGNAHATGSQSADNFRTTGDTASAPTTGYNAEVAGFNEARSSYQPSQSREVTVVQRRLASKPSRNLVIGSAVAGAIAGGAIPFMLSGRKSAETKRVEVDATRSGPSAHVDRPAGQSTHMDPASGPSAHIDRGSGGGGSGRRSR